MQESPYQGDDELVQALQKGDSYAQFWLVKLYAERIKAWIRYRCRTGLTHADIEELTSKAFEKIIRGLPTFDPTKARLKTWMYKVADNTLRDHERQLLTRQGGFETAFEYIEDVKERTKKDPDFFDPRADSEVDPDDLEETPDIEILRQALENLPEAKRIVLTEWAYLQSHAKIAKLLGKREGTIRVEFLRAKRALKQAYERLKARGETS